MVDEEGRLRSLRAGRIDFGPKRRRERGDPGLLRRRLLQGGATAQTARAAPDLATWFTGLTAVSSYEQTFAIVLEGLVPGGERDRAGSVVAVLGSGNPRRLADGSAGGLDR